MRRVHELVRTLLTGAVVLAGLAGGSMSPATAQRSGVDPSTYESELSGIEIEVSGGEFEILGAEVQNYSHGQGEIVDIASNTASVQIAFFDDTDTNEETLEIYNDSFSGEVDDFEVLDEGEDRDTVFSFAVATYEGVEFYYYLSVTADVEGNVDLLQQIFATEFTFFEDFETAQESIEIGRDGFLEDVEVADLEDAADAVRGEEPADEPTEEPEAEPTEEPEQVFPTIDPQGAAVRDLVVVDAQLVTTQDVAVGEGAAELPAYEEIPMQFGGAEALLLLLMAPESPEATLDRALSIFTPEDGTIENIGTDADRTAAWSLDYVEDGGQEYLLYVHVQNDRFQRFHYAEILFAPVDSLVETIEGFRQAAQIDGVPMFAEADLETIEWLLAGGEDPDSREQPADETREDEKSDTGQDRGEGTGELDLESQGLVSETEYESPQTGLVVEWEDGPWGVDLEWELTAESNPETGIDSVILLSRDLDASVMVQILPSDGAEPADYVQYWETEEYMVDAVDESAEVLMSDSSLRSGAVVYTLNDANGDELIIIKEMIYINGEVDVIVTLFVAPDAAADAYADVEDYITVDGEDAAATFTPREIERVVEP